MATNFDNYAPFDSGSGAGVDVDTWRAFMQHLRDSGVIATHFDPEEPNELEVYADSSGMQVKVRPGEAWVRAHWSESLSEKTLPIAPSDASLPRLDRVVVRADLVAETVDLVAKTGALPEEPDGPEPPPNLVVNPDFANNTDGWSHPQWSSVNLSRITGLSIPDTDTTTACRVTLDLSFDPTGDIVLQQNPRVDVPQAGTSLVFTAQVRASSSGTVRARALFYDQSSGGNYMGEWDSDTALSGSTWTDVAAEGIVPAGAESVELWFWMQDMADGTVMDVTDVYLATDHSSPTPIALPPEVTNTNEVAEITLAMISVDAGVSTIAAGDVTDERKRVGSGIFNSYTPTLYGEGAWGTLTENPVNLGTGGSSLCRYLQVGNVLHIRYYFQWGDGPYDSNARGRIFTKLPPGFRAAETGDHRLPTHLWTADGGGDEDWAGSSLISEHSTYVFPFSTIGENDTKMTWYVINDYYNPGAGSGRPLISGGYPEGGHLVISGTVEVDEFPLEAPPEEPPQPDENPQNPPDDGDGGDEDPPPPPPPPPPDEPQRYTKSYIANWSVTYDNWGSGHGFMYQGYYDNNAGGLEYSKWGFEGGLLDQIRADLWGSSIVYTEIWLKNAHSYWSSGIYAMIGTAIEEGEFGAPPTAGAWDRIPRVHFGALQGKWVPIGNFIGEEFRDGLTATFLLGSPFVGSRNEYGYFDGAWNVFPPTLRITYDK